MLSKYYYNLDKNFNLNIVEINGTKVNSNKYNTEKITERVLKFSLKYPLISNISLTENKLYYIIYNEILMFISSINDSEPYYKYEFNNNYSKINITQYPFKSYDSKIHNLEIDLNDYLISNEIKYLLEY